MTFFNKPLNEGPYLKNYNSLCESSICYFEYLMVDLLPMLYSVL